MENVAYTRYHKYYQRLEPILKQPHVRAYTMAILSFFALSFFGAFAIRPAIKEIFELNRKIVDRRLVDQKLNEKVKNLQLAEIEYEKLQEDLYLIMTALPQTSSFPPLLKSVETLASSSGIILGVLKFQDISLLEAQTKTASPSAGVTPPNPLPFEVGATGSYPNLLLFTQGLEKNSRLINIDSMIVSTETGNATASGQLRLSLKARAYFRPDGQIVILYE